MRVKKGQRIRYQNQTYHYLISNELRVMPDFRPPYRMWRNGFVWWYQPIDATKVTSTEAAMYGGDAPNHNWLQGEVISVNAEGKPWNQVTKNLLEMIIT